MYSKTLFTYVYLIQSLDEFKGRWIGEGTGMRGGGGGHPKNKGCPSPENGCSCSFSIVYKKGHFPSTSINEYSLIFSFPPVFSIGIVIVKAG